MAERASAVASEIRRHDDIRIPVGDETVAATRYEPVDESGTAPALLMYVPYPKDDVITYGAYDPFNRYLAGRGYEVVVADMVGTGASTGTYDEMFSLREGEAGAEIVRWLAAQDWTSGRVGMYGKSYGGITALATAAQRPEPLDAIVPIHTPYVGYRNAYTHGGLFELNYIGMEWLTVMQALDAKPPSKRDADGDWRDVWTEHLDATRARDPWLFQFLDHDLKDEYWATRDIPVGDIETPTLAVGGWRDSYTRDTLEYVRSIDAPKRTVLGPWRHTMPHRGRERAIDFRRQTADWFDRFLTDRSTDPTSTPDSTIQVWTERDGGGEVDGGVWRGLPSWPRVADDDGHLTFALTPDGLRRAAAFEDGRVERSYEPDYSVGVHSIRPPNAPLPPRDTNADDVRSLCFETDPLDRAVEYTGTGRANVRVQTDVEDPTASVRVVDVAPDGSATLVAQGARRVRCDEDLATFRDLPTDEPFDLEVQLEPASHVFESGHRIRVAFAGAFFPATMATGSTGSFELFSTPDAPSVVELPGRVMADRTFDDEIEIAPPDQTVPPTPERVRRSDVTWETTREELSDRATVRKTAELDVDLPYADMTRSGSFEVSVLPDDPGSVAARNELELTVEYPTESVTVVAANRFGREFAEATTTVTFDDRTVFEEHWTR